MIIIELETRSGIYAIKNKTTQKLYIGQSIDIYHRWNKHVSELNNGHHHNDYLQKAWNKYGEKDFECIVLEYCDQNLLDEKEQYYINLYDTTNRDVGYNLKQGGQFGGSTFTEEAKQKMSKSIKASYTEELRKKRSNQQKEMWSDPNIRAKRVGENASMYGHHHTDEVKKRLSEFHKGKSFNRKYTSKVLCIETGEIYDNASTAGKALLLDSSCILKVCKGERYTCGTYHWKFITEENNLENKVS